MLEEGFVISGVIKVWVSVISQEVVANIILSNPLSAFQHWLGDFARLLKVQFTSNEGMSNAAPIYECESEIDHYTGHYVPY